MQGKIIKKGVFDESLTIDVSELSSGIYILGVIDEEEIEYHKFVK